MNRIFIIILISLISFENLFSQETFPINGVEDNRENHYAFFNANIVVDYNTTIENGTLIILETSVPTNCIIKIAYNIFTKIYVRLIGRVFSKNYKAYS